MMMLGLALCKAYLSSLFSIVYSEYNVSLFMHSVALYN